MGFFDLFSSETRHKREAAIAVGLEVRLCETCPVCREVTEKQASELVLRQAEDLAEAWVAASDQRVAAFDGDVDALKQQLRELKKSLPYQCLCEQLG